MPVQTLDCFPVYLSRGVGLLVCTRTQHWAQLMRRLVPSSATWGLDSWPCTPSFVLAVWVLKHISGMSGLDHWRPPGRFTSIKLELSLPDSDFKGRGTQSLFHPKLLAFQSQWTDVQLLKPYNVTLTDLPDFICQYLTVFWTITDLYTAWCGRY